MSYGYATTMRRAQGATLHNVGLVFDRRKPDRGYAYVGASRAKTRDSVYYIGTTRRTDWLPVGAPKDSEQLEPSAMSETSDAESEEESPQTDDTGRSTPSPSVSDFPSGRSSLE